MDYNQDVRENNYKRKNDFVNLIYSMINKYVFIMQPFFNISHQY